QAFLDSQARVLDLIGGSAAPAAAPAAPPSAGDPAFPLLGPATERSAACEVCERVYTLDSDPFLRDHCIGGAPSLHDPALSALPVIPFTFSLEICAEAAVRLIGNPALKVVAIEQARGSRWLSLDDGQIRLRIVAERIDEAR